jgi:hypothetical protein
VKSSGIIKILSTEAFAPRDTDPTVIGGARWQTWAPCRVPLRQAASGNFRLESVLIEPKVDEKRRPAARSQK